MFLLPHNTSIEGHLKIWDDATKEIFVDKRNAINPENFSVAFAESIAGQRSGIYELHFGNGGTSFDTSGKITYNSPIVVGGSTSLYNPTFFKVVNVNDTLNNTDPAENYITTEHTSGRNYTDIVVNALLDYYDLDTDSTTFITAPTTAPGIIPTQAPLANATSLNGEFIFDEIGLKSKGTELNTGLLLTHIIFNPIQKAQNRRFRIQYTVRVRVGAEIAAAISPTPAPTARPAPAPTLAPTPGPTPAPTTRPVFPPCPTPAPRIAVSPSSWTWTVGTTTSPTPAPTTSPTPDYWVIRSGQCVMNTAVFGPETTYSSLSACQAALAPTPAPSPTPAPAPYWAIQSGQCVLNAFVIGGTTTYPSLAACQAALAITSAPTAVPTAAPTPAPTPAPTLTPFSDSYTFAKGSPANDFVEIPATDANGLNVGAGRQTLSFVWMSDRYFELNPIAHFAVVLRANPEAVHEAVPRIEGNGLVIGNVAGYVNSYTGHTGNPLHPSTQIKTWHHGAGPPMGDNDLLPQPGGPILADGVPYTFEINSDVDASGNSFVSYSVSDPSGVIYSLGPQADNNIWFTRTKTGIFFAHVFQGPDGNTPVDGWTVTLSSVNVTWS